MWEELSFQIINIQLSIKMSFIIIKVCKNYYKKENISVGGSEHRRDALF